MSDEIDEYPGGDEIGGPRPRDHKIDDAKAVLMARFFPDDAQGVYYGRQLEIALENEFFHWITKKALNELAAEGKIKFNQERLDHHVAHFYSPRRHRYPRRQIGKTIKLIAEFSEPTFTRALGHQGEALADAGFAYIGFRVRQRTVREVDGLVWTETNHDLDRLIERDGLRYGVEIKNQLGYIDQTEFQIKLAMCKHFRVRPLFIARMMPRSYVNDVYQAGGFCLLLDNQHYPLMSDDLMRRVRQELSLPVAIIRALPDTAMQRFEEFHVKQVVTVRNRP
jgi:hypothetical protein